MGNTRFADLAPPSCVGCWHPLRPSEQRREISTEIASNRLDFAVGSMGPKVEAACEFVRSGGAMAGIRTLGDALAILSGKAGTVIQPEPEDDV